MQYRGPILLVFGMSLIISPLAIKIASGEMTPREAAAAVRTVDIDTGCQGQSLNLANRGTLCTEQTNARQRERTMPGGAMFVQARN
jgi:hypothetical protein